MNENTDIIFPYQVWLEFDLETDEEKTYSFATFEEAENYFKSSRRNSIGKIVFQKSCFDGKHNEIIATYYP